MHILIFQTGEPMPNEYFETMRASMLAKTLSIYHLLFSPQILIIHLEISFRLSVLDSKK